MKYTRFLKLREQHVGFSSLMLELDLLHWPRRRCELEIRHRDMASLIRSYSEPVWDRLSTSDCGLRQVNLECGLRLEAKTECFLFGQLETRNPNTGWGESWTPILQPWIGPEGTSLSSQGVSNHPCTWRDLRHLTTKPWESDNEYFECTEVLKVTTLSHPATGILGFWITMYKVPMAN